MVPRSSFKATTIPLSTRPQQSVAWRAGFPWEAYEEDTIWFAIAASAVAIRNAEDRTALTDSVSGRYCSSENGDDNGETHCSMMPCLYVLYAVLYTIATIYVVKQGLLAIWRGARNHLLRKQGLCQPYCHLIRSILSPVKQRGFGVDQNIILRSGLATKD